MGPAYAKRPDGKERAAPRPPRSLRFPSVSAAQAAGQAQSHIGSSPGPRPPHEGGYLQTTRRETAARSRFEFPPWRRAAGKSQGLAALRPVVSSEAAPAAWGALG